MSQRRQKKQLSILENVQSLSDHELRDALKAYSEAPGPITDSTRNLYRKKLASLISDEDDRKKASEPNRVGDDDDDDTSDEDYNAQDEESDDDEDEESESEESELGKDELEDIKLSSTTVESDNLNTSVIVGPDASPNRVSRNIVIFCVAFFVAIFSFYIYLRNNCDGDSVYKCQAYTVPARKFMGLVLLSSIGYVVYLTVRYYLKRRQQETQRVCGLVNEALELLQSPDNPKGSMPILHIRDTLLTPAERKAKKMIGFWNKAVKFIEEHESRVKVELVNIDGEDFRAWKWIGSKKL